MKCFLLLLALELVTSNKLDRTYLPPPGAKLAGGSSTDLQTPLEYPKETYPGTIQAGHSALQENTIPRFANNQGLEKGMSKAFVPNDFSTSTFSNDLIQTTSFPASVNDATKSPSIVSYDNFPPKSFDVDNSLYKTQQFYSAPNLSTGFGSTSNTNDFNIPVTSGGSPGYYYFVPADLKTFETDKINQGHTNLDSNNHQNTAGIQYPQANNGYLSIHGQNFTPKPATAKDIVRNYQPSAFGYYGGNPMIMTSQNSAPQKFGKELATKYGEYESNLPTIPMSISQDEQYVDGVGSVVPFQTPLVGMNVLNPKQSSVTNSVAPFDQPQYPLDKEDTLIGLEKRISTPVRPKLRPERPQAVSDRSSVIISYENVISPEGYSYSFDTSNGIHKDESGTAINGVKAKGSYSYTGDDGKIYSVTYTADENGFQPKGEHLPTPPPIPEAIKKVIEQAARDKAAGIVDDGSYDENKYGHMNYQGEIGRYRPYKESQYPNVDQKPISKLSKPNGAQKGTNYIPVNKDVLSLDNDKKVSNSQFTYNRPTNMVSEQVESRNGLTVPANTDKPNKNSVRGQNPSIRHPVVGTNNNQQLLFNENNADANSLEPNNIKQKSLDHNDGPVRYENDGFIPFGSKYNQNGNLENQTIDKLFQAESPGIRNMTKNTDTKVYNQGISNQVTQINPGLNKQISSSPIKSYDNGYFYVPPIVKFQREMPFRQNSQQPFNKNNAYVSTTQPDFNTIDKKPTGLDGTQSQIIFNTENVIKDSTRKPYISGPDEHDGRVYYEDMQPKSIITGENDKNQLPTFNNDLYPSNYMYTTTPMPLQTQFGNQPTDGYNINQFYQTTINPVSFDKTLTNNLGNRFNIPEGTPRVSVSQDIVTSTFKPGTFGEGINLEVNQNVKIYGVGRPTDATLGYPDKVSIYTDGLYTTTFPEEESRFSGTYSDMYNAPASDDTVIQSANQDVSYGNNIFSTASPVPGIDTGLTGYYYPNPDLQRQPYVDTVENLKNSSSIQSDFGFIPSVDKTTPTYTKDQNPTERVIGEDFSGPKQPQRFDSETGYHYK